MPDLPSRTAAVLSDPVRLRALRRSGLLDPSASAVFDRYTRLATQLLGTPIALLSLVDAGRQVFASRVGLDLEETPLSHSFCQHVVSRNEPLAIGDARAHELTKDNAAIEDLGVEAYVGAPVRGDGGEPLGSFCAIGNSPRFWTPDDVAVIEELAEAISAEIALRIRERRARAVTNALTHASLAAGDDGAVYHVSSGWPRMTGQPVPGALGDGWADAVHPDERASALEQWHTHIRARKQMRLDCRVRSATGGAVAVRFVGVPVWAEQGTFTEYVGAVTLLEGEAPA
jgi:PAS domain-containing protein